MPDPLSPLDEAIRAVRSICRMMDEPNSLAAEALLRRELIGACSRVMTVGAPDEDSDEQR